MTILTMWLERWLTTTLTDNRAVASTICSECASSNRARLSLSDHSVYLLDGVIRHGGHEFATLIVAPSLVFEIIRVGIEPVRVGTIQPVGNIFSFH